MKIKVEIGLPGMLTIIFLVLKITNVIEWSWWWVVSPLLIIWGAEIVLLISKKIIEEVRYRRWEKQIFENGGKENGKS